MNHGGNSVEEENGWCGRTLAWNGVGSGLRPELFHGYDCDEKFYVYQTLVHRK